MRFVGSVGARCVFVCLVSVAALRCCVLSAA